jgi:hypothetical protein
VSVVRVELEYIQPGPYVEIVKRERRSSQPSRPQAMSVTFVRENNLEAVLLPHLGDSPFSHAYGRRTTFDRKLNASHDITSGCIRSDTCTQRGY